MTAQQEIASEARKAFRSRMLMSLNTESDRDPENLLALRAFYQADPKPLDARALSRLFDLGHAK